MIRLVTRGRLTQNYAKGLLAAPEDREPAVRKLIEAAGGKIINFYFTTGDSDFLLISEANDAESIIAALMAAAAADSISDVTTARAWQVRNSRQLLTRLLKHRRRTESLVSAD